HIKFNLTIPLQQLNGLETLVIIMVANKYAFLQITRRRFLNEWEAFKKVISTSSHIGATAKDISNVVTDAASGVVDIFHGIDKAVADTWNNFWKDGKADGIGSNLSRK